MSDKIALIVADLGAIMASVTIANGYNNDVIEVDYGVTNYDQNTFEDISYPRVNIICNNVTVPDYSTTASRVQVEVKISGYLRKEKDIETDLASYQESLGWANDMRKAIDTWLKQIPEAIDCDLIDNQINQTIGFPMTLLTCSNEFGLIFDECY